MRSYEQMMEEDLSKARSYSRRKKCTVWCASNGQELIWSNSRSQVDRDGFWICSIFENGNRVEA